LASVVRPAAHSNEGADAERRTAFKNPPLFTFRHRLELFTFRHRLDETEADQALFASLIDNAARYGQRVAVLSPPSGVALRPTAFVRLRF
jgi:hypothetical protein